MKKILMGIGALAVAGAVGLVLVWSNLDGIVKEAIETYGSEATKTEVSVANVTLELESGNATIKGLHVANPAGFKEENIFQLGDISVKVDVSSLNKNPIVIDEIIIKAPELVYEINDAGVSNVDVLKSNLGMTKSKVADTDSEASDDAVKMIIGKLVVERTKAKVRVAALGSKLQTVSVPRILLTDVGKKSGGATAAELAKILSSTLIAKVKSSAMKQGMKKYLGQSADSFKQGALDSIGKKAGLKQGAGAAIQGFLGQ
ncbi:MAG: hypothetical protein R8K49_00880 [Mariprofundaceae bacterium]